MVVPDLMDVFVRGPENNGVRFEDKIVN